MNRSILCLLALSLVSLVGCRATERAYPGHSGDAVWQAMLAAAETPHYPQWTVRTNEVWVDEAGSRLEIYRELERDQQAPGRHEYQHFETTRRLGAALDWSAPPRVIVESRGVAIPGTTVGEADRFFAQIATILGDQSE